ncbi:hypothetical protein RFI_38402 [Reticulomyxa filosa]|uniref:Uncharacterized protein n=1 Tax=Reticulomyxa filosa TaxID=46433 RepID=X6LCJ4_RETFI|nr:hypothetical protein RFI_38402 [Reticulomyxa filosa]|eukprot:ETN99085.1 hypothetical protein RFI_38402 [Reticulomyxa filosa]
MEIYLSSAILSNDDTNVHVIGGFDAKGKIQKIHVNVNVDELFEKSELLKMPEILYIIPIEKQRMNEDEKENAEKKRKTQIETFEKKLKEWDEEKRTELNGMNWDDI